MPYWLWNIRLNALAEENPFCSAICWMLRFSCRSCISICGIRYRRMNSRVDMPVRYQPYSTLKDKMLRFFLR